jgi:polysaccharide export outer membrane protein
MALSGCQSVSRDLPDISTVVDVSKDSGSYYRLQPGDVLESHFGSDSSFNEQALVAPDGRVSFFYAADVQAAGHTVSQLRDDVASKAGIMDASFVIALRNTVGTRVYVVGEVNSPGEIVVNGPISALEAISRAGGYKLGAQSGRSVLLRRDVSDKRAAYAVDLASAADGRNPREDVSLQSYDIVYVPRDRMANISLVFERVRNAVPFSFYYSVNTVRSSF